MQKKRSAPETRLTFSSYDLNIQKPKLTYIDFIYTA